MNEQGEILALLQTPDYQAILSQVPDLHSQEMVARVCSEYITTSVGVAMGEPKGSGEYTKGINVKPEGSVKPNFSFQTVVRLEGGLAIDSNASGPDSTDFTITASETNHSFLPVQLGYGPEARKDAAGWGMERVGRENVLARLEAQTALLGRVFQRIEQIPDSPGETVAAAQQKAEAARVVVGRRAREAGTISEEGVAVDVPLETYLDLSWRNLGGGDQEAIDRVTDYRRGEKARAMKEIGTNLIRYRIVAAVAQSGWNPAQGGEVPESLTRTAQEVATMGHQLNGLNKYPRAELDTPDQVVGAMKVMATFMAK